MTTRVLFNFKVLAIEPIVRAYSRAGALVHASMPVVPMGDTNYQVEVSDEDKATGVILVADGDADGADPRRQIAVVAQDGLFAVPLFNPDGTWYTGEGSAAWDSYRKPDGLGSWENALPQPELTNPDLDGDPQRFLWVATIPKADIDAGVSGLVSTPGDSIPEDWPFLATDGDFSPGIAPEITELVPAEGTPITRDQGLSFKITDADNDLQRGNVFVYYPALGKLEAIYVDFPITWDGGQRDAGFMRDYTGTRTAISGGYQFTNVVRRGGWPSRPILVVDPRDAGGNEGG